MPAGATPLAELLAERICQQGPISFADYMETCLYHVQYGYYTKRNQQAHRDYFTSVDVSPLFGRLLARQFEEMWIQLERPTPFLLVEVGAGSGALAKDILDSVAQSFPEFYAALGYLAVERSEVRRRALDRSLKTHLASGRCSAAEELPGEVAVGCIFSNELLDALPVHRVIQQGVELREIYVTAEDNRLREVLGPLSSSRVAGYFAEQGIRLCDGQQAEAGLAACDWMESAGRRLERGFVVTIDYGHEAGELYDERHMRGTLLAYERHRASEDFYRAPGDQDLTAHVNFTALELRGQRSGLVRSGLVTQTNFLLALARASNGADVEAPGASENEKARARLLFKTLINPEGMGETFQVLVQHKGIAWPRLSGFKPL
jgi:SAM-dependent MidA family methyltransferase